MVLRLPISSEDLHEGAIPRALLALHLDLDSRRLELEINIASGQISGWPASLDECRLHLKVAECGEYSIIDTEGEVVAVLEEPRYVPHGLIPGKWGDYVSLIVDDHGVVRNWPTVPSLGDFVSVRS